MAIIMVHYFFSIPDLSAFHEIYRKACEDNAHIVAADARLSRICSEMLSKTHVVKEANETHRQQQQNIDERN